MPTEDDRARVVKRSLVVAGHRTSVSLEDAFWRRLQAIAASRRVSVNSLAAEVDVARGKANLSSALRVFVLEAIAPDLDPGDAREDRPLAAPDRSP
jgi:predicted DNA-binding ribbon-helix-helix protein